MSMQPSSAPLIETERLELWQPRAGEYPEQLAMISHPETRRFLGPAEPSLMDSFARELRNAGCWSLYGYGTFYARLKGQTPIIGGCGVFRSYRGFGKGMDDVPEAGWIIHHDHGGQGYASEAMQAILAWFDRTHGVQRITCMIEEGNTASDKLAQKLGFVRYGSHVPTEEADDPSPLVLYERIGPF